MAETYGLRIACDGSQSLEILDKTFNDQSQYFLQKHGLRQGMQVLDIGCGSGHMTQFLAEQVGPSGSVLAIDVDANLLKAASKRCPAPLQSRIQWLQADVYELEKLQRQFDLIYCRFVLHHLTRPRFAVGQIKQALRETGIYIAIEGIVNYAYSLPNHPGWQTPMWPLDVPEGEERNGNIGKLLPLLINAAGMQCQIAEIYQPLLLDKMTRHLLLQELLDTRDKLIFSGEMSDYDWQRRFNTVQMCVDDPSVIIAFYAGNFIAAKKT